MGMRRTRSLGITNGMEEIGAGFGLVRVVLVGLTYLIRAEFIVLEEPVGEGNRGRRRKVVKKEEGRGEGGVERQGRGWRGVSFALLHLVAVVG